MDRTKTGFALGSKRTTYPLNLPCGSKETAVVLDWRQFGRLAGFTNQKNERRLENGLQPFVKLCSWEGQVYTAADEFLCHLEGLRQEILSQRELQTIAQGRTRESTFRPISSFHTDPRHAAIFTGPKNGMGATRRRPWPIARADRERNPQPPGSLEEGLPRTPVLLRGAHCQEGNRNVYRMTGLVLLRTAGKES
jgi:hypothetical protein